MAERHCCGLADQCQFKRDQPVKTYAKEWDKGTPRLLRAIADEVVAPLLSEIPPGTRRLVFSPHQILHLLPLHLCPMQDGHVLGDLYEVVYTPSLSLLRERSEGTGACEGELLLVENPTCDLTFSALECLSIRHGHRHQDRVNHLRHGLATRSEFLAGALSCRAFHYCGHGLFEVRRPLASPLRFSDGTLRLRDVFNRVRLPRCELAVLSGCETGMASLDPLDTKSFAAGFLYAGARCVLSALWTLPDLSSALTMTRFYECWRAGQPPAAALRSAQLWLRNIKSADDAVGIVRELAKRQLDAKRVQELCARARSLVGHSKHHPFASPVHWGPFICTGMGF